MHALCSLANQSGLRVESRPDPGFRREVGVITPLEVAGPYEKRVVGLSGSKLRRACRIALMESDHPQSCEEIVQRIQRRGSLSFEARSNAQAVVEVELERMTRQGEAIHQQQDGGNRWNLRRG